MSAGTGPQASAVRTAPPAQGGTFYPSDFISGGGGRRQSSECGLGGQAGASLATGVGDGPSCVVSPS